MCNIERKGYPGVEEKVLSTTFEKDRSSDAHKKEQDSNLKVSFISIHTFSPIGSLTGVD